MRRSTPTPYPPLRLVRGGLARSARGPAREAPSALPAERPAPVILTATRASGLWDLRAGDTVTVQFSATGDARGAAITRTSHMPLDWAMVLMLMDDGVLEVPPQPPGGGGGRRILRLRRGRTPARRAA